MSAVIKRFAKWLNLGPPETQHLGSLVASVLVPALERLGFTVPGEHRLLVDLEISGREIALERPVGDCVDVVSISFDKYHRPRFQIHAARRLAQPPHAFVRACCVVANSRQYYYFWGKAWWFPSVLWTDRRAEHLVNSMSDRLEQVDRFLMTEHRGQNISK